MADWAVGLSTGCFYRYRFLDCLQPIAAAGFSSIEMCSYPGHLDYHDRPAIHQAAGELRRRGMVCFSYHGPFADSIDLSAPETATHAAGLQEMLQAVEAAAILEARYFVLHPGPDRVIALTEPERLERRARTVESVQAVALHCRALGPELVLENMLNHLALGSSTDFFSIVHALPGEPPGFCLDTGHALLAGNLTDLLARMGGRLRMLHGNDNRGQGDDHLPPGQGLIDWDSLVQALTAMGFAGGIILELAESDDVERTLAEARTARSFLHRLQQGAARLSVASP